MKQEEISAGIKKNFKKIHKLFDEIIIDFEMESIHQFRTGKKKLRGFLRLLNMEEDKEADKLKLTEKMKTFYGYMGSIRNLQIQLQDIYNYLESSSEKLPASYIEILNTEIENTKR